MWVLSRMPVYRGLLIAVSRPRFSLEPVSLGPFAESASTTGFSGRLAAARLEVRGRRETTPGAIDRRDRRYAKAAK